MTDTDRIDHDDNDVDGSGIDDGLDDWEEYSNDEPEFDDFLDWLNGRV